MPFRVFMNKKAFSWLLLSLSIQFPVFADQAQERLDQIRSGPVQLAAEQAPEAPEQAPAAPERAPEATEQAPEATEQAAKQTAEASAAIGDSAAHNKAVPLTNYTLHGGIIHSESLAHVNDALDRHRNSVKPASETAVSDTFSKASVPEPPGVQSASASKAYLPETGIATPAKPIAGKFLSAEVQKYSTEWFMIPAWLAGKWQKDGDLTVSTTDLKTGETVVHNQWVNNKMESTWGHRTDAAGNFWHVNLLPAERDGQSDGKLVRFLTVSQSCEKTDGRQLVTRTHYVVSESNFWNGQPVDMFQQESLNHYFARSAQEYVNISTNRVFTYAGQPVRDGNLQSQFRKISGFYPLATLNGIDLKQSLNDYLESHGLSNLVAP